MNGSLARGWVFGLALCLVPAAVFGQGGFRIQPIAATAVVSQGELHGIIRDEHGAPLRGAVVSASVLGSSSVFALSDREGRYAFRNLPPGAYLVRAVLQGYSSPKARRVDVPPGTRQVWEIALSRIPENAPVVLAAGIGGVGAEEAGTTSGERPDDTEVEWRIRHQKRGVLKDAYTAAIDRRADTTEQAPTVLHELYGAPSRFVSLFDGVNGQINLLTTTSFERPQDLFEAGAGAPRPIAYVSIVAPLTTGDWAVRGSMTEGDISSWNLAGSFKRTRTTSPHHYEVGLSYATQRYQGGNVEALAAMRDGSRNVGEMYVDDSWSIAPQLTIGLGGRYASYDYLADRYLLGGRLSLAYQVAPSDPLRLRVTALHRELAPGAEEFVAPSTGLWLPPERTFSSLSRTAELRPEKVDVVEISGERPVGGDVFVTLRAFRQQVSDQMVTLFGGLSPESGPAVGHYRVASAGDFENYGWGVTVTKHLLAATEASFEYTMTDTQRRGLSTDRFLLRRLAPGVLRREEQVHDLTASVNSRLAPTNTRFVVVYKLNNAYAEAHERDAQPGARFDVQVNQEMPFLDFTGAKWEMLVAVKNLFRTDLYDGSVYDELLVVRPPKRVTGGVTVRF